MSQTIIVGRTGNSSYSVGNGTRNITISGIPWTLAVEDIALIFADTQNLLYHAQGEDMAKCTVSSGVITIDSSFPVLATGDVIHIQLFEPNRGVDQDGHPLVTVQNQPQDDYTDPETSIAEEDQADAAVSRYVIPLQGHKEFSLDETYFADTADDTITRTIWLTDDAAADDSADTGWKDKTNALTGSASLVTTNTTQTAFNLFVGDKKVVALKMMIRLAYVYGGVGAANNSADVILVKH